MRVAVLFDNLGPYHIARLTELGRRCDLFVVEQNAASSEYSWAVTADVPFRRTTLFGHIGAPADKSGREICRRVHEALSDFQPDVVVVPGWASKQAIAAAIWAHSHRVPMIVMSDSQEIDFPRRACTEWIKSRFLACSDGALVAGSSHRDYVAKLGMDLDRVRLGYDIVDNEYFRQGAIKVRESAPAYRASVGLPAHYFLTSARFVEKKNLATLINAFCLFLRAIETRAVVNGEWSLVILGDGALRPALEQQILTLGMTKCVLLPGFKQYPELPVYYGLAEAFFLPSTTEQWGLVVNEAMASGLPVVVSERCGSAADLVKAGVNGYVFDPSDVRALADVMINIAEDDNRRHDMGAASSRMIDSWSPEYFASNLMELAKIVKASPRSRSRWLGNLLLRVMLHRPSAP